MNILKIIEQDLTQDPFPVKRIGNLGLKASIIPKEQSERTLTWVDKETQLQFAILAMRYKLTPDELVRRLMWAVVTYAN